METLIPGLFLYPDFIDPARETKLLNEIDGQSWIVDYQRRLQYYGFRNELETPYNLVSYQISIPQEIDQLALEIVEKHILDHQPDQVIINEYLPGQGIKSHKDRAYYENQICGINLGSGCVMKFTNTSTFEVIDVVIPRRSLYVMQDDARKKWSHAIPPRKKDMIDGNIVHRDRRVSITYRKVKPSKVQPLDPNGKVAQMLAENLGV